MPTMDEDLRAKPCPFCGRPANLRLWLAIERPRWIVECGRSDCLAEAYSTPRRTKRQAIDNWNKRAPNDSGPKALEKRVLALTAELELLHYYIERYARGTIPASEALRKLIESAPKMADQLREGARHA